VYDLSAEHIGTHSSTGLMQSLAISGREWESMLIDCITGIPRVQWEDSVCAVIVQFRVHTLPGDFFRA
jgi:hypothetical protein